MAESETEMNDLDLLSREEIIAADRLAEALVAEAVTAFGRFDDCECPVCKRPLYEEMVVVPWTTADGVKLTAVHEKCEKALARLAKKPDAAKEARIAHGLQRRNVILRKTACAPWLRQAVVNAILWRRGDECSYEVAA